MKLSRIAAVTLVIGVTLVWASQRAAFAAETIPWTDVNGGLIQVQGSLDGRPAVPMLVNLGAGVDVLSSNLGRQFVAVNGKYVSLRLTGERTDLPIGKVVTFAIGGVNIDAPHVGIWSGLDNSGVDGLISATAFRNVVSTFDFRNRQIVIEDAQTFPDRVRMETRVPLILQDDLGIALALFARFDFGNGKTGLCEIDTGSQGITLDKTFAAAAGLNPNNVASGQISSIQILGAPQTRMASPAVKFADLIYDCDVGNSFWAGRTFTLDLPNRFIYVSTSS